MPTLSLEAPGRDGESWVTTEVAARWLGVSDSTFLRLIGRKKGGTTLPGVSEWMRPHPHSAKELWDVADVILVRHILTKRLNSTPTATARDEDDGEKT